MKIFVVNAGSSSLKLSLFDVLEQRQKDLEQVWNAQIDRSGNSATLTVKAGDNGYVETVATSDREPLRKLIESMWSESGSESKIHPVCSDSAEIRLVGHRIVHGGTKYSASTAIDETVLSDLRTYVELAPEHEQAGIDAIELAMDVIPAAKHVAVFDTAYHSQMPLTSKVYAGPYDWYENLGIQRFGFHGINHKYCVERARELLGDLPKSRIVTCHLGSGGSLCASLDGRSIMTTMGFTPLDGLVMRTRSGTIDSGVILHLLRHNVYTASELSKVLNESSGLRGISGLTGDMRDIEKEAAGGNHRAQLAFDVYEQSVASGISSLLPVLGGLDALVFSGGIGEHSARVRSVTCQKLSYLGLLIDEYKNENGVGDRNISATQTAVQTLVIEAREDLSIARECLELD